jgi:hypothetical protein
VVDLLLSIETRRISEGRVRLDSRKAGSAHLFEILFVGGYAVDPFTKVLLKCRVVLSYPFVEVQVGGVIIIKGIA